MNHASTRYVYGTTRQRITSIEGIVLERQNIYLPPEGWEALKRLSNEQGRSGSQVIESLITLADKTIRKN